MNEYESLILIYSTDNHTFVWAIPPKGTSHFAIAPMNKRDIWKAVTNIRKSLDPDPMPVLIGGIPAFNINRAYELYEELLIPVREGWKDAKKLIIVSPGALSKLPFSVLPTKHVNLSDNKDTLFAQYRKVPWLIRDVSIIRLPAASSLVTLRKFINTNPPAKEFLGFGDPLFNLNQLKMSDYETTDTDTNVNNRGGQLHVRGVRTTETGQIDNISAHSIGLESLIRLPDTAEELKSIANILNVNHTGNIYLRKEASEHQVKHMVLFDRRIIAFASHALLPGDLDGLHEPAIALSSPTVTGNIQEDGLLTLQEIVKLKLNADWVVLSACNTGAGIDSGSDAISGLGRGFFYAGTRAILASMWSIETTSAKVLTIEMFKSQKQNATLSRSEALRQSMLKLIDEKGFKGRKKGRIIASYAHPFFWAPFVIFGDG